MQKVLEKISRRTVMFTVFKCLQEEERRGEEGCLSSQMGTVLGVRGAPSGLRKIALKPGEKVWGSMIEAEESCGSLRNHRRPSFWWSGKAGPCSIGG